MNDPPDEIDQRIRSLDAERLRRPVPGAPAARKRPSTAADVAAARREAHDLHMIETHLAEVARRRAVLEELATEDDPDDPETPHRLSP